jgi:hypothetical protein
MKRSTMALTIAGGLLAAGWAMAQTGPPLGATGRDQPDPRPQQAGTMREDIEILRRILDRALPRPQHPELTARPGHMLAFSPDAKVVAEGDMGRVTRLWDAGTGKRVDLEMLGAHAASVLGGPEGTYLKGYGVVYTVTLPFAPGPLLPAPAGPKAKPPSEWERTRKELHGEKAEPGKAPATSPTSLADVLLKLLAENGSYFSQLAEDERLTVVVTLPPSEACARCHGGGTVKLTGIPSEGFRNVLRGREVPVFPMGKADNEKADAKDAAIVQQVQARMQDAQKQVLLGDLHAKQGRPQSAAETYQVALKAYAELLTWKRRAELDVHGKPMPDPQLDLAIVDVLTKLAQAELALGHKEKALEALDRARRHAQALGEEAAPAKPASGKAEIPLPGKLTVSAPKKLLDQMGNGKVSFEQFCKDATVEYLPPSGQAKEPVKP